MKYISTRGGAPAVSAPEAIARGLAPDGGLYVPERMPLLDIERIAALGSYPERAAAVLELFIPEFEPERLLEMTRAAYTWPAPVTPGWDNFSFLELYHGPTLAFKDMALQLLPHLLTASLRHIGEKREVCILVATSGDTGKAALEGFRDIEGTRVMVFYPRDGVSPLQELQMTTQEGSNVQVCAVNGNFDDAQTGVKRIFSDAAFARELDSHGLFLSSANSINLGRLLPQIAYYVSACCDMGLNGGRLNICVPTGNFGNILAASYAREMGLPVGITICASNSNDVLEEFLRTGHYNAGRSFYRTLSPSMDILVSSNLERALYAFSDASEVRRCMDELRTKGEYTVSQATHEAFSRLFAGGSCDDERTVGVIERVWREHGRFIDPHTAVAVAVAEDFAEETGDGSPLLIVATADPFKFISAGTCEAVESAAKEKGLPVPAPIRELFGKPARFYGTTEPSAMIDAVRSFLL